ncbi:MAG: hypothetical protein EOO62_20090, partial [Hymenobacter sp.]
MKNLFPAATLLAALSLTACDSKTATTGEARTAPSAEAAAALKNPETAPTSGAAATATEEA